MNLRIKEFSELNGLIDELVNLTYEFTN